MPRLASRHLSRELLAHGLRERRVGRFLEQRPQMLERRLV